MPSSRESPVERVDALLDAGDHARDRGDVEEAQRRYARALELAPEDAEAVLALAELKISRQGDERGALEEGIALCERGRKLARRAGSSELLYEFAVLQGMALNQLGECRAALEHLEEALRLSPRSTEAALERGLALFELCRLDEAAAALGEVVASSATEAWAHHYLGLIAERRGDAKEARRRFARAHELAPEEFPQPTTLSEVEFDAAVEDALARLPEHVKQYLENTTIAVEPLPADDDLTGAEPPLSPTILGVFRGPTVGERGVSDAAGHQTAAIVLYQRNLERFARTREELIEQIGITLMHEVGHLMGLDEDDLWERGLD